MVQPKFGGRIIDIVSRDMSTPEQKAEALNAVKNTILYIFLIVVIGYDLYSIFRYNLLVLDSHLHFSLIILFAPALSSYLMIKSFFNCLL